MGVCGVLIYCADYRCSHSIAISGDAWPDDARLSDIEDRFVCRACGKRGCRREAGLQFEQEAGRHDGLPQLDRPDARRDLRLRGYVIVET